MQKKQPIVDLHKQLETECQRIVSKDYSEQEARNLEKVLVNHEQQVIQYIKNNLKQDKLSFNQYIALMRQLYDTILMLLQKVKSSQKVQQDRYWLQYLRASKAYLQQKQAHYSRFEANLPPSEQLHRGE